mmetsp:Transcript_25751/g.48836  ORF Transcript_25751/g.48836 Transcript_25751/m.48836 type:complete len:321 (-) Transcript_25751:120-1082(-)
MGSLVEPTVLAQTKKTKKGKQPAQQPSLPSQALLVDLCTRFVANVPPEELESFERMMFHIEQAHWFYEDNVREEHGGLKSLSLREFAVQMFTQCSILKKYTQFVDDIYKNFNAYKQAVPTHGAIILNPKMDKVLLVQGYSKNASWGFPKGKVNKDEEPSTCAIREVLEETGFDISPLLEEHNVIDKSRVGQSTRCYIIPNVPEDTRFETRTKGEIGSIAWHLISSIPKNPKDTIGDGQKTKAVDVKRFYNVAPFLAPLQKWIKARRLEYKKNIVDGASGVSNQTSEVTAQIGYPDAWENFAIDVPRVMSHLAHLGSPVLC